MSIFSILFKVKGGIFSIPFNMKVCCEFSLESPHLMSTYNIPY